MKQLYGSLVFFLAGTGTFRLVYGAWPPTAGDFGQWLSSDSKAKWAICAGLLAALFASAIARAMSGTSEPEDPKVKEAADCFQRGLAYHQEKRVDEAEEMFKRAIVVYEECGREADSAQAHASLGKLYFDTGAFDSAETHLKESRVRFQGNPAGRDAVLRIDGLLRLISERRTTSPSDTHYADPLFKFSLTIPSGWVQQALVEEFVRTGGRLAISHISHAATFNVSVAPPDKPEWLLSDSRGRAAKDYVQHIASRTGPLEVVKTASIDGENNVVVIEYHTHAQVGGGLRRRRNGFISIVHKGIEYTLQWSAESELEGQTRGIIASFGLTGAKL
jgi:hypothetical protein